MRPLSRLSSPPIIKSLAVNWLNDPLDLVALCPPCVAPSLTVPLHPCALLASLPCAATASSTAISSPRIFSSSPSGMVSREAFRPRCGKGSRGGWWDPSELCEAIGGRRISKGRVSYLERMS